MERSYPSEASPNPHPAQHVHTPCQPLPERRTVYRHGALFIFMGTHSHVDGCPGAVIRRSELFQSRHTASRDLYTATTHHDQLLHGSRLQMLIAGSSCLCYQSVSTCLIAGQCISHTMPDSKAQVQICAPRLCATAAGSIRAVHSLTYLWRAACQK